MRTKKALPMMMVLLLVTAILGAVPEQNKKTLKKPSKLFLEIYGGYIAMQPEDLNLLADYYNAYPLFFYSGQYDYLHSLYGNDFTYSVTRSGDEALKTINKGIPLGIRVRYALSRSISVSLNLDYLRENRLSSTEFQYRITDLSQGPIQTTPQTVEAGYSDFFLGVSAWIPQIGIHVGLPLGENWRLGGSVSAGPLLARCRSVVETRFKFQYQNGYWSENFYLLEMKGAATGLAFDLNGELRRRLTRRLSCFMTAGYAWHRAANVTGSGRNQSLSRDSNAVQDMVENSWEGRWQKKDAVYLRNWGEFRQSYYGNYFSAGDDVDDFVLDLSGFQVKAGFSWAF